MARPSSCRMRSRLFRAFSSVFSTAVISASAAGPARRVPGPPRQRQHLTEQMMGPVSPSQVGADVVNLLDVGLQSDFIDAEILRPVVAVAANVDEDRAAADVFANDLFEFRFEHRIGSEPRTVTLRWRLFTARTSTPSVSSSLWMRASPKPVMLSSTGPPSAPGDAVYFASTTVDRRRRL